MRGAHRHHGALEVGQEALQPRHAGGVEMVGGLVQEEDVGLGQQQLADGHAAPLTSRQVRHQR
eukprot:354780-Prorocentrum_minimum.AAC.1